MPVEQLSSTEARRCACILVVDDEPIVAGVMADVLGLAGYEVETAQNGREALERIATRSYDLILCDLQMPELDGAGLYRELERQQPSLLQRLAFVSGSTDVPEYASFCQRTAVTLLGKPFSIEDLLRLVQRLLGDP
jgi:CheY-like chemotaxis protein